MIGLDTNILVRFLVRDDEKQSRIAYKRFKKAETEREKLFIPLPVILETIWVLESAYNLSRREILDAIEDLSRMPVLLFEKEQVIADFLAAARKSKVDCADMLIAQSAKSGGCDRIITFDKKAARFKLFKLLT